MLPYLSALSLQKIGAPSPSFHHVDSQQRYLHQKLIRPAHQPDLHMQPVLQFHALFGKSNLNAHHLFLFHMDCHLLRSMHPGYVLRFLALIHRLAKYLHKLQKQDLFHVHVQLKILNQG